MKAADKKINYTTMPVPSSPPANSITNKDGQYRKGSGEVSSKMPEKNLIPDGSKKK